MKAKELMIGDWVMVYREGVADCGQYFEWQEVGHVIGLGDKIITVQYSDEEETETEEDVKPIQITPEILEKNGFKGEMYAFLDISPSLYLEYYYHEHRLREWWTGIDEWNNDAEVKEIVFKCQCHYIHELQHALRLCGIEKEIEL